MDVTHAVAFALGFLACVVLLFLVSKDDRCPRIKSYGFTYDVRGYLRETTVNMRCELEKGHDGPHLVTLNENQRNERQDWFEDEPGTVSAAEPETNDDQAPVA